MRLLPEPAPTLPQFRSLVVHGPYLSSAPIHLCLSVPPPHNAILCTPSRNALLHSLSTDHWLNAHSSTGTVTTMSSRVTVFYPPSPQALLAVLATLRTHDVSDPSVPIAPKVTLDRAPSLLVLHELSSYFLPEPGVYTVSSYLLLITHALSTVEFLSSQSPSSPPISLAVFDTRLDHLKLPVLCSSPPISLAVFDTRLDHLKLPVLRTPPKSTLDPSPDGSEDSPRPEPVLPFVEKYFELSGTFQSRGPAESDLQTLQTPVFAFRRTGKDGVENLL